MREIDQATLVRSLQEAPAHTRDPRTVEESDVDIYLIQALYPMLVNGTIRLDDVEYDQFEADDLRVLAYYVEENGRRSYPMEKINFSICRIPPASTAGRTFF